jgi:predicted Rdx family selenoprotein
MENINEGGKNIMLDDWVYKGNWITQEVLNSFAAVLAELAKIWWDWKNLTN